MLINFIYSCVEYFFGYNFYFFFLGNLISIGWIVLRVLFSLLLCIGNNLKIREIKSLCNLL